MLTCREKTFRQGNRKCKAPEAERSLVSVCCQGPVWLQGKEPGEVGKENT